jgi:hypothetical protein
MAKAPRPWRVTRHDPIEPLEENLWAVNGDVPGFPKGCGMLRRMCIVKLSDGRLAFHNAIPLDDASLAKVIAWGKPAILILPVWLHALDGQAFAQRLGLKIYASKVKIETIHGAHPLEELPPELKITMLSGTKFGEPVFEVRSADRSSLLFADALQNSRPGHGFGGFMFKLLGFTGSGPKAPPAYKMRAVSNKAALANDLRKLAETPNLARVIPSHGDILSTNCAAAIRAVADSL